MLRAPTIHVGNGDPAFVLRLGANPTQVGTPHDRVIGSRTPNMGSSFPPSTDLRTYRQNASRNFIDPNLSIGIVMLRHWQKVPTQFRHEPPVSGSRARKQLPGRLVVVRINLSIQVNRSRARTTCRK